MNNPLERQVRISIGSSKNFTRFKATTVQFNQIWKIAADSSKAYSFSWYKNDYRLMKYVIPGVDVVALDFDTCEKVEQLIHDKFDDYYGFIIPTKSYMKDKGGIVVPRYRVILLLEQTTYLETLNYSQAYCNMVEDLGLYCDSYCGECCANSKGCSCDTAVKDPSRLFYGANIDISLIRPLKGGKYLDFKSFDYKKPPKGGIFQQTLDAQIDISRYRNIDIAQFENLDPSKRYECPICAMNDDDPNKHHLGVSADGKYVTCFYDTDHSVILRKLKHLDMLSDEDKEDKAVPKLKATPDLIPVGKYDPHPNNVDIDKVRKSFDESIEYFKANNKFICLDIETYSPEYLLWSLDEAKERLSSEYSSVVGAYNQALANAKTDALDSYLANVRIISISTPTKSVPFDVAIMTEEQLHKVLEIIRTAGLVCLQNGKYDLLTLAYRYGIDNVLPKRAFDTMLAARIHQSSIDVEPSPAGNSLGPLLHRYCGIDIDKEVDHTWGEDNLTPVQLQYAIRDTKYLPVLMNAQIKALKDSLGEFKYEKHPKEELEFLGPLLEVHPIVALEMQFLLELVRIEYNGVQPNAEYLREVADTNFKKFFEAQEEVGVNLNSPKQLKVWLQQNVDPNIDTTSGKLLDPFYGGNPMYDKVMDARKLYKNAGLLDAMTCTRSDGLLHPHFTQILNTGRQSCKNPNMQQIPRDYKHAVYMSKDNGWLSDPEKFNHLQALKQEELDLREQIKECTNDSTELSSLKQRYTEIKAKLLEIYKQIEILWSTDYAAVELRVIAAVTSDKVMINAYRNGEDLHYMTAESMFHKKRPVTEEEKEQAEAEWPLSPFLAKMDRLCGKKANFTVVYGSGNETLLQFFVWILPDATPEDMGRFREAYFKLYPGAGDYVHNAFELFRNGVPQPRTLWLPDGRKIEVTNIFQTPATTLLGRKIMVDGPNSLLAYPVQGSAADALKLAICYMRNRAKNEGIKLELCNQVHDDLIARTTLDQFDKAAEIFRDGMRWSINYVTKREFYTEVNQDFLILSAAGKIFGEYEGAGKSIEEFKVDMMDILHHQEDRVSKIDLCQDIVTVIESPDEPDTNEHETKTFEVSEKDDQCPDDLVLDIAE